VPSIHSRFEDVQPSISLSEVAATALGFALIGAAGRGRTATLYRLAGAGLIAYALEPLISGNVRRAGNSRRHIDAHGSVEIARPIDEVFSFFKDFESFPRVAAGLRSVVDYQDGRSHWEAYAPAGSVTEWDVVVTKYVPRSVIAWESVPGSDVDMRGIVRFTSLGPECTRIDVNASYRPTPASFNVALRSLLDRRRRPTLDGALNRVRAYLESQPRQLASGR
jgi:uncharacterized membrane protein